MPKQAESCITNLFFDPKGLTYGKTKHKKLYKHMYVYYMSICLTSGSYQQKQNAGKIQRNIKTYKTFLVQALINHIMVSVLPPDCPTLPDGRI
jgi:hypothetical protein